MYNAETHAQSGLGGQVLWLENDLSQTNCSIIISNLTAESGSYQLAVLNARTQGEASHGAFIAVKDLIQKPSVMIPPLTEGQQTTLTCTALGLCSGSDPEITWTWSGAGGSDSHITGNVTAFKTEDLTAVIQRYSSTLTFNPSAIHNGTEVVCKVSFRGGMTAEETVTLSVTYVKKHEISGKTTVKQGDTLNVTCNIDGFPLSLVMWTKVPSSKDLQNRTETDLQNNTGTATLVITNVTADQTGQYICTGKHLNTTVTVCPNVTVTPHPKILNSSGCITQSEVLTCVCTSQSQWFPLPAIRWPLLENHTEYSVTTTVSNRTVNSTMMLTVKDQSITVVECVSSSENGEVREKLIINKAEEEEEEEEEDFVPA
ncbi:myelin-associated glycoprotein-like [Chaetodon trifascialis]|uniref:myelin-associated glycoprotein-like n=1 Tax=Chaetodon trifascialis TaxID=109706 RepID=UPI00399482F6